MYDDEIEPIPLVNYPKECAKAVITVSSLCQLHPHATDDCSALDNARLLYFKIHDRMPTDFHITNYMALHIDYFADPVNVREYEMTMTLSIGRYDLGKTSVAVFGSNSLYLCPDKTYPFTVHMPGMSEYIGELMKLLKGKAPWELTEEEMRQW